MGYAVGYIYISIISIRGKGDGMRWHTCSMPKVSQNSERQTDLRVHDNKTILLCATSATGAVIYAASDLECTAYPTQAIAP